MKPMLWMALVLGLGLVLFFDGNGAALPPGVIVAESPVQHKEDLPQPFVFRGYTLTPLAHFEIRARVLSRKRYRTGRESELSPLDLALGWGPMSDSAVLEKIEISQSGRWYRWKTDHLPIPRRALEIHSANMHLIPGEDGVERAMLAARKGDIVRFSGYLVRADASDGWRWISSLIREDVGDGACEVIFVNDFFQDP
jgi:hypothetical protein